MEENEEEEDEDEQGGKRRMMMRRREKEKVPRGKCRRRKRVMSCKKLLKRRCPHRRTFHRMLRREIVQLRREMRVPRWLALKSCSFCSVVYVSSGCAMAS